MNPLQRILLAATGLVILAALGAIGFAVLERLPWQDALYLSVATISTVGYGDIVPLTASGRLFAVALIAVGVGLALYLVSLIAGDVFEGRLQGVLHRSSMMREIRKHQGHVIVCGYGRFGRVVVEELMRVGRQVVVIDNDPALAPELDRQGIEHVIGSADDDETLIAAGIGRADALVTGISGEAVCVFVTLAARELNPDLRIHARGESDACVRRLRRAGADFVTSPYQMGGLRTAASILRPAVVDFLDLSLPNSIEEIDLEELRVDAGSELEGLAVFEIEGAPGNLRVIALKRGNESIRLVPDPGLKVNVDDHLVVIGERERLLTLAKRAEH